MIEDEIRQMPPYKKMRDLLVTAAAMSRETELTDQQRAHWRGVADGCIGCLRALYWDTAEVRAYYQRIEDES